MGAVINCGLWVVRLVKVPVRFSENVDAVTERNSVELAELPEEPFVYQ